MPARKCRPGQCPEFGPAAITEDITLCRQFAYIPPLITGLVTLAPDAAHAGTLVPAAPCEDSTCHVHALAAGITRGFLTASGIAPAGTEPALEQARS